MIILSNFINRVSANPIRILSGFFVGIDKLILKFIWILKNMLE